MKTTLNQPNNRRKGVILLVVLAMLTLLAIIGITFVMYASSLEQISEAVLDEQKADYKPYLKPEAALNLILGQLVYDVEDDTFGKATVLRGHSLARNLYGYTNQVFPLDRPFGGSGFSDPTKVNFFGLPSVSGQPNVGYTAPDSKHWFLAKSYVDPVTKTLKIDEPSFWRNNISSTSVGISDQKTFRYRPGAEMANGFPPYPPQQGKYDVINLPGGTVEDSIWIDINSPIQTLPNGKKYKMMVAPLVLDMDGRLNLNWAGNRMARSGVDGVNFVHGSHEGYGPWEANLDKLMTAMGQPNQQATVLNTKYGGTLPQGYALGGGGSGSSSGGYSPRAHFQVDFNGGGDINEPATGSPASAASPAFLPGSSGGNPFQSFPYFPPGVFGNWSHIETSFTGKKGAAYIHPVGYNPSFPGGSNIAFALRDLGPLLLWHPKKDDFTKVGTTPNDYYPVKNALSPHLTTYGSGAKPNFLDHVTLHSADFDKPGLAGYFSDRKTQGLLWSDATTAPFYPTHPVPSVPYAGPGASPGSEFNTIDLAIKDLTRMARINLSQIGPDYPLINPASGLYATYDDNRNPKYVDYTPAEIENFIKPIDQGRKLLALKVLDGLCAATGTPDMRATPGLANPQYKAWVWLAQLAVNIVDFVDPDDVMTVLELSPIDPMTGLYPLDGRKVYGTELPKVVLNEIYAQVDNSPDDLNRNQAMEPYTVSVFLELLNPTPSSVPPNATNVLRDNNAFLQGSYTDNMGNLVLHSPYNIDLASRRPDALDNPFIDPPYGIIKHIDPSDLHKHNSTESRVDAWKKNDGMHASPLVLSPSGSNFNHTGQTPDTGDKGFLWIGPKMSDNIPKPFPTPTPNLLEQPTLRYTWLNDQTTEKNLEATILLSRLANPAMKKDPDSNPYVLVDYVTLKKEMIQDARKRTNSGVNDSVVEVANRKSYGRRQPYAGKDIKDASEDAITKVPKDLGAYVTSTKTNGTSAPKHTFGQLNFNANVPPAAFTPSTGTDGETPDWLVHYDRQLVSPAGLLLVSTFRPHELTQKFVEVDTTTKRSKAHQHCLAWMDEATGLQRFLELVQAHGEYSLWNSSGKPVALLPSGGRIMGRVNLNTMPLDETGALSPVLDALFDTSNGSNNPASHFIASQVRNLATRLATDRKTLAPDGTKGIYIKNPNPFSRAESLLKGTPTTNSDPWEQYLLQWDPYAGNLTVPVGAPDRTAITGSGSVHPLVRLEMLDKILNQSTIRSNVFGIWLTVGFFEVTDSTSFPVKLGGEIGAAAGRQTRYKLFSLVDRTRITAFETATTKPITVGYSEIALPTPFIEPRTGKTIDLIALATAQPLVLTIDPDTVDEETVEAEPVGNILKAVCRKPHATGAKIISRGNPGPMKDYKVNDDSAVVFYWTILE